MRRDFFYYTKSDRRGLAVLLVILLLLAGVSLALRYVGIDDAVDSASHTSLEAYKSFRQTLSERDSVAQTRYASKRRGGRRMRSMPYDMRSVVPKPFDPNRDDSAKLVDAGLPPFVASNMVKYRAKGGRFRKAEDVARIYGMTNEIYVRLSPYILIEDAAIPTADTTEAAAPYFPKTEKYPEGTVLNLNTTDTSQLKRIPGIGSGRAKRIVAYRDRIGGFVALEQLSEIEGLPDGLERWFEVAADFQPRRIDINKASLDRMRAHPYIGFYRAKAIVEYRRKHGRIRSLKQLSLLDGFDDASCARLLPYVDL